MKKNKNKEKNIDNTPVISDEEVDVKIVNKKGKKVKVTKTKTSEIKKNNKKVLEYGTKSLKDLIAVGVDRSNEDYLKIGNKYVKSFIITGFPPEVEVGWLNDLYNFPGDLDVQINMIPSDERGALDQLTQKITQFEVELDMQRRKGNIRNITSLEDKIRSLVNQRRALERNYETLLYIQVVANLYEDSLEELKKQSQKLIRKLAGKRIKIDDMYLRQEDSYKSAVPVGDSKMPDQYVNGTLGVAVSMMTTIQSEISHRDGIMVGINMSTVTPSFIDFYDRNVLNNSNACVFGTSGSGKSFFGSLLTLRSAIKGIKTVIIDPEGEYKKICDVVGGANIKLEQGAERGINPFDIEEEYDEDNDVWFVDVKSKVSDVLNLIAVMVEGLSNEAKSVVSYVLAEVYKDYGINEDVNSLYEIGSFFDEKTGELINRRKKEMPTLSVFKNKLNTFKNASENNVDILGPIINTLGMFCKGGIYDMFDRQTSDELKQFINAPVVNFDVSGLEDEILRPLGMYVAMSWAWEKFIKKNPEWKKRLICDEAWMLLNKNMAGYQFTSAFLEKTARRIRKKNGGLFVLSQNFVEFADNKPGKAVLTNSAVKIFLKQNTTDIDALQETFKLSHGERGFLLNAKKGEILLKIEEESTLAYAYPTPYELRLITGK